MSKQKWINLVSVYSIIYTVIREPRKICVKENKRHPFSQESEQERT
jgi:hypothetical protein